MTLTNNFMLEFRCGGCSFKADAFIILHKHVTGHKEGGNYFYHHASGTAYPKHEYSDVETQTEEQLPAYSVNTVAQTFKNYPNTVTNGSSQLNISKVVSDVLHVDGVNNIIVKVEENSRTTSVRQEHEESTFFSSDVVKLEPVYYSDEDTNPYSPESNHIKASYEREDASLQMDGEPYTLNFKSTTSDNRSDNPKHYEGDSDAQTFVCKNKDKKPLLTTIKRKRNQQSSLKSCLKGKKEVKLNQAGSKFGKVKQVKCVKVEHVDKQDDPVVNLASVDNDEMKFKKKKDETRLFKCLCCPHKTFLRLKRLGFHIESTHLETYPIRCDRCSMVFIKHEELSNHSCEIAFRFNHVCNKCPREICFKWRENLQQHLRTQHNIDDQYECSVCQKRFISELDLKSHAVEHDPSQLVCPICKKTFRSYINFESHQLLHKRKHVCELCGKSFDKRQNFKHHSWACKGKFACKECNKTFCTNNILKSHMLIHLGERPFICEKCGQPFRSRGGLKSHLRFMHTFEKNYKCTHCEKAFTNSTALRRHERVHLKIRPHPCEFCNKEFSTNWNLKAHMRQHNGTKPYVCIHCGTGFAHNVARKNHELKCQCAYGGDLPLNFAKH